MKRLAIALSCLPLSLAAQESAQEEEDKGFIVELIEDNLSSEGTTVSIQGFEGALSSNARLAQLTVADVDGVWLTLNDVELIWSRAALLRGAIDVDVLRAGEIIVARAPITEPSAPSAEATPFALPELPVSIDLDTLSVERLELGESFLGETLVADIAGSMSLGGGDGQFEIAANREGSPQGTFSVNGDFSNATRELTIDMALSEGAGGIAARLIGLPGDPSVDLTLAGNGPLSDFGADLAIATDGIDRIAGTFRLTEVDAGSAFDLDISGDVSTLFVPDYRDFLGQDVSLTAKGRALIEGGFELSQLDLSAQSLNIAGRADIDADGFPTAFDLTGMVEATDGDIVLLPLSGPKTFIDRADLSVQFDAATSDQWTADIQARNFDRPGLVIENLGLQGGGIIRQDTGEVTANLTYAARGLVLDDSASAEALGDSIEGQFQLQTAAGEPITIEALTLRGAGIRLNADAVLDTRDGFDVDATLGADVAALDRFSALAGLDLAGGATLSVGATAQPLDGSFDVSLNGETRDLAVGIPELDGLMSGVGTIDARLIRDSAGTRIEGARVNTDDVSISADANLTSGGGQADLALNLREIATIEPRLNGPARLVAGAVIDADQSIEFDAMASSLSDSVAINGSVEPSQDGRAILADFDFDLPAVERFAEIAARDVSGSVAGMGNVVLLSDQTRFSANLNLTTRDLQTGTPQVDPLLEGEGAWRIAADRLGETRYRLRELSIETPWLAVDGRGSGDLEAAATAVLGIDIPVAERIAPGLPGRLNLVSRVERSADLVTSLAADLRGAETEVTLEGTIASPQDDYRATGKVDLAIASLSPLSRIAGRQLGGAIQATLEGGALPDLSEFSILVDAESTDLRTDIPDADKLLRGTSTYALFGQRDGDTIEVPRFNIQTPVLNVSGDLTAAGDTGRGTFEARLADIGLFTDQLSGPVSAQGTATRGDRQWGIDVDAAGPGGMSATAQGSIFDDMTLDLRLSGGFPLGLANGVLDPRRVSGDATFDLGINGQPSLNNIDGTIRTSDTDLTAPNLGQTLEGLEATVTLSNGSAQISASTTLQSGGRIDVAGPVALSQPFSAGLTARLRAIEARDPNLYSTLLSGIISVDGPLANGARISGTIDVAETEVRVPSSSIGALGELPDVVHFGASSSVRTTLTRAGATETSSAANTASASGPDFPLDITVNAPNRLFIRGRGLDAELGGQLVLGGTTNNIVPVGQFSLVRGRLDILQQRFELSEGSASLQGDFIPFIRLVANTESSTGTDIRIIVEGPASEPEVRFESTPELPQDEVLSQLIFGRSLSDISPLQAVQLAAAVGTLAGRGGGGIVDGIRQNLNLDDFDVTTDEEGNAAVRAGAYLSENIYTDVTVSSDGSTEINLNLDVTDEITAKGSVDDDGETSIGIFFERDY